MTSEKQAKANRENALKSTGPKTLEGKDAVRLNAVKHGLLSQGHSPRSWRWRSGGPPRKISKKMASFRKIAPRPEEN